MLFDEDLTSRLTPSYPDPNNNIKNSTAQMSSSTLQKTSEQMDKLDKYSLRPRSMRRCRKNHPMEPTNEEEDLSQPIAPNTKSRRGNKPKQKPAPLSKYRRRTANARERTRMKEINLAFEALRQAVPQLTDEPTASTASSLGNEKLTKITTLRLAMKYINTLSATLNNTEDLDLYGDLDLLLESDGESLPMHSDFSSDQSLTDFSLDFDAGEENSLNSVDFCLEPLSPGDLPHHISSFDPFLSGFS